MRSTPKLSDEPLYLLAQFDRGYYAQTDKESSDIRREVISCWLFFRGKADLDQFLVRHAPIPAPFPKHGDKYTKWEKGYTCTRAELKALGMTF